MAGRLRLTIGYTGRTIESIRCDATLGHRRAGQVSDLPLSVLGRPWSVRHPHGIRKRPYVTLTDYPPPSCVK